VVPGYCLFFFAQKQTPGTAWEVPAVLGTNKQSLSPNHKLLVISGITLEFPNWGPTEGAACKLNSF
jgi:hypothetical protein